MRICPGLMLLAALCVLATGKAAMMLDDLRGATGHERPLEPAALALRSPPGRSATDAALMAEPAAGPGEDGRGDGEGPEAGEPADSPPDNELAARIDPATLGPRELEALGELVARRTALEERERELELRAALLDDAETKLAARLSELESLKRTIEMMLEDQDAAEEAKLASLVKIYEGMKPKAAAEIFNRLEMAVLVKVVSRMREGIASEIIGRMTPERAEQLTAELAIRARIPGPFKSPGDDER